MKIFIKEVSEFLIAFAVVAAIALLADSICDIAGRCFDSEPLEVAFMYVSFISFVVFAFKLRGVGRKLSLEQDNKLFDSFFDIKESRYGIITIGDERFVVIEKKLFDAILKGCHVEYKEKS